MEAGLNLKKTPYQNDLDGQTLHRPLFLGCSGGSGHNLGILACIQFLANQKLIDTSNLPEYLPRLPDEVTEMNGLRAQLRLGLTLTHDLPFVSAGIRWALKKFHLPLLPTAELLSEEIEKLKMTQLDSEGAKLPRPFIDMLLDVCPTGYENVAIWNILQRTDAINEIKKTIELQFINDQINYPVVKDYFFNTLMDAEKKGHPYTEIISTQAMCLPALCDALLNYNQYLQEQDSEKPGIKLHLYMTDLPKGAVHFFKPLLKLSQAQCQQIYIYGLNLTAAIVEHFNLQHINFAGLFSLNAKNNPLVRNAFQQEALRFISPSHFISLPLQNKYESNKSIAIKPYESVASVMLGSQASADTVQYVKRLAYENNPYQTIFVFGGKSHHISKEMMHIMQTSSKNIILLDHQDDKHIASILARSQLVIIRGGGLSVMEQLALPHLKGQIIFIHAKEEKYKLTSGILWEDENTDFLIESLEKKDILIKRTAINRFENDLYQIKQANIANFS